MEKVLEEICEDSDIQPLSRTVMLHWINLAQDRQVVYGCENSNENLVP
jgi:hypothetical protein